VSLPVVYRQSARQEIVDAARRYERERKGLAAAFTAEVSRIESLLSETPSLYQTVEGDVRRATLRRFPYGLFYLDEPDRILILACVDLRRDPQVVSRLIRRL
jgi:hypothetical protein